MNRNERNSRLLIIIGIIGLSGYVLNNLLELLRKSFNEIPLQAEFPIGSSHVIASLLMSGFIVILLLTVIYILLELNSFRNLEHEDTIVNYSALSDFAYSTLLKLITCEISIIIFFSIILTLFDNVLDNLFRISVFYNENILIIWLIFFLFLILVFIFRNQILEVIKKVKKTKKFKPQKNKKQTYFRRKQDKKLYAFINRWGLDSKENQLPIISIFIFLWFLLAPLMLIIGVNSTVSTKFSADFHDSIKIEFHGKTDDYIPINVKIQNISGTGVLLEELNVNINDFNRSVLNVTSIPIKNNNIFFNVKKSEVIYIYEIGKEDLRLIQANNGHVIIEFNYEKGSSKEIVRIENYYSYSNGKVQFNENEYGLNL